MQIVIDTNVFVDGTLFSESEERAVLRMVKADKVVLLVSIPIIDEIVNILYRICEQRGTDTKRPQLEVARAMAAATLVDVPKALPKALRNSVPEDPEDAKFVACAHYGSAEYIVSNDGHLLGISGKFRNAAGQPIQVVTSYDFGSVILAARIARRNR